MYDLDRKRAAEQRDALAPTVSYDYVRGIASASLLYWGEHCIECAEPACFATCDLYDSRPDGRCRRFTWGIVPNAAFPAARGYGAEVSFKKWGKLEARGNAGLMPYRRLLLIETLANRTKPAVDRLGGLAWRVLGDARWRSVASRFLDRVARRLHRRRPNTDRPDVFLLEIFNPATEPTALHVTFAVARKELASKRLDATALLPSFRKRLELPPGYSRHEIPYADLASVVESGLPFDISMLPEAHDNPTLVFLSSDFVRFSQRQRPSAEQPPVKCVVWDLDNTIWKGTLLEDDEVEPLPAVTELLRVLDQRGILSSVASKNAFDLAFAKIKEIGIEEYILYPQISWASKSDSIRVIAEKLNIGLDTVLFIDDNDFELSEVAQALPLVTCINARDITGLAEDPRLQGSTTDEAKRRRVMYREAMTRESEERKFGDDFFGFLKSCEITLTLTRYTPRYYGRVCELMQRTNQLNFSGMKYRREAIAPILADPALEKWVLECSDKFGSYGVVGFSLVARRAKEVWVKDFMLSCRVQGRFVEQAFFNVLVAENPMIETVSVSFIDTGRNSPARQVLLAMGFATTDTEGRMNLDLRQKSLACDFISVELESSVKEAAD
jgi:FkbH-like protein